MQIYRISKENYAILYHGTNEKFDGFYSGRQVSGYYPGFYVTTEEHVAQSFGSNVIKFISEPLKLYDINNEYDSEELKKKARLSGVYVSQGSGYPEAKYLENNGYDGIRRGEEIILFNPSEVLKLYENL
jgi:hypothetical protein